MTTFVLIRHAANDTVGKKFAGRMRGIDLNDAGMGEAMDLVTRVSEMPISAIYSSPSERATQTAEPMARALGIGVSVREEFSEIECGDWTNRTFEALAGDERFRRFNSFRSFTRIPAGELMLEAQARMVVGLEDLYVKHPDETVAVVSHADPIKCVIAYFAGIPLDLVYRIEIGTASISVVEVSDENVRIMAVNKG